MAKCRLLDLYEFKDCCQLFHELVVTETQIRIRKRLSALSGDDMFYDIFKQTLEESNNVCLSGEFVLQQLLGEYWKDHFGNDDFSVDLLFKNAETEASFLAKLYAIGYYEYHASCTEPIVKYISHCERNFQIQVSVHNPSGYQDSCLRNFWTNGTDLVFSSLPEYVIKNRLGSNRSFDQNHLFTCYCYCFNI